MPNACTALSSLGLRFPFIASPLAVEEAETNLADSSSDEWAALAGAESPPSDAARAGVAALLALLGDPRALPAKEGAGVPQQAWAAAKEAAASHVVLERELQACGPYGASAGNVEAAARWLHGESRDQDTCPLFTLQRELEKAIGLCAADAARADPELEPEPKELRVKALPPTLLSHRLAFVLALLADAFIHARKMRFPYDLPPGWWSIIPFSQLHLTLRQAALHQRNCVLDCPTFEAYDAARTLFQHGGDVILDLQQLNVKAHLAKKVSVDTARAEIIRALQRSAFAGQRLVLLLKDQPHDLHTWLDREQLPKAVFKRGHLEELRRLLDPSQEVSPDFQVVFLSALSVERAEELLPVLLPAYDQLATLQLEASSVPSVRQVRGVKPVGDRHTPCLRAALRLLSLPSRTESLAGCFRKTDSDGGGTISREELRIVLETLNPSLKDRNLDLLFDQVDTNEEGKVGFAEFIAWLCGSVAQRVAVGRDAVAASTAPAGPLAKGVDAVVSEQRWLSRWLSGSWLSDEPGVDAVDPPHAAAVDGMEDADPKGGLVVNTDDFEFHESFGPDWERRWWCGPRACDGGNDAGAVPARLSCFPAASPASAPGQAHTATKPCIELAGGVAHAQCGGIWTSFDPLAKPTEVELEFAMSGDLVAPNACVAFTERHVESSMAEAIVGVHFMVRQGLQMASSRGLASIGNDEPVRTDEWIRVLLKIDWGRRQVVSHVDLRGQGYGTPVVSSFCDARCEGFGFVYIFNMDPHSSCWFHTLRVKQDH